MLYLSMIPQDSCLLQDSLSPPVSNAHTSAPEQKQRSHWAPQTLPLRPAEMVSMRTQDLERPASPDKTKAVLTKLNQNSDGADCQTLELITPGLGLPYSGKKLQWWHLYYCTELLRTEKTRDISDPIGQSCPSSEMGFLPAPAFVPLA